MSKSTSKVINKIDEIIEKSYTLSEVSFDVLFHLSNIPIDICPEIILLITDQNKKFINEIGTILYNTSVITISCNKDVKHDHKEKNIIYVNNINQAFKIKKEILKDYDKHNNNISKDEYNIIIISMAETKDKQLEWIINTIKSKLSDQGICIYSTPHYALLPENLTEELSPYFHIKYDSSQFEENLFPNSFNIIKFFKK